MARDFVSGSSEYIRGASSPVSDTPFSISCWFNPDVATSLRGLVWIGDSGVCCDYWVLATNGSNLRFRLDGSFADTVNTFSTDSWNHACSISAASNDHTVVLNGDWANRGTSSIAVTVSPDRLTIGRFDDSTPGQHFDGEIMEVGVWDTGITQSEVEALADGYSPLLVRPSNLVFYYPAIRENIEIMGNISMTLNGTTVTAHGQPILRPHVPYAPFAPVAVAAIFPDSWHPGIERPYPSRRDVVSY